jgi:hypothetical protein
MTGGWIAEFFRKNFYTMHGHKKVPSFILNSAKDVRESFLHGFYAGDGLKDPESRCVATNSQTLAQGIMLLEHSLTGRDFSVYDRSDYPNSIQIKVLKGNKGEEFRDSKGRFVKGNKPQNLKPRGIVKKVYTIPYKGWVYDIETEDPHKFTTGVGPIKVANSVYEYEYPYFLLITEDDPLEMEFVNNTGFKVIQDFSIFLLECAEAHWPIVQQYLKGLYNFFHILSQMEKLPILKAVEKLGKEE